MLTTDSVVGDLTHIDEEEGGLEPVMSDLLHDDDGSHDSGGFNEMGPSGHEKEPTAAPVPKEVVKRKPGRPPGRLLMNAAKPKGTAIVTQRRSGRVVDQEKDKVEKEPPGGLPKRVNSV